MSSYEKPPTQRHPPPRAVPSQRRHRRPRKPHHPLRLLPPRRRTRRPPKNPPTMQQPHLAPRPPPHQCESKAANEPSSTSPQLFSTSAAILGGHGSRHTQSRACLRSRLPERRPSARATSPSHRRRRRSFGLTEWRSDDQALPDYARGHGSPTILIDERDVAAGLRDDDEMRVRSTTAGVLLPFFPTITTFATRQFSSSTLVATNHARAVRVVERVIERTGLLTQRRLP